MNVFEAWGRRSGPYNQIRSIEAVITCRYLLIREHSDFKVIKPATGHLRPEFETLDTGMAPPEEVRRGRVRDSELVEDEGVEVWKNTVE